MRLWVKDSERRPDPEPVRTDDRVPIAIGIAGWTVALVVLLLVGPVFDAFRADWLVACAIGILLGVLGLVYVIRRRH